MMADAGVALASQSFAGNHLWHIMMLAAWVPLFGIMVLVQRRQDLHSATTHEPTNGMASVCDKMAREVKESDVRWYQCMALGLVCAAMIHVAVMPAHFAQSLWYGSFFLLAAIGQCVFALAIATRPSRALVTAGVTACALIIALWLVSRFVGVPIGPDNGATEPVGVLDVLASVAEASAVVFGVLALRNQIVLPSWRWSQWSPTMRLAAPICITGTVVASLLATRS